MKETYVFVVDENKNVIHQGVLVTYVRERVNGNDTHALIKGPDDDHEEIHPINHLFYKIIGDYNV